MDRREEGRRCCSAVGEEERVRKGREEEREMGNYLDVMRRSARRAREPMPDPSGVREMGRARDPGIGRVRERGRARHAAIGGASCPPRWRAEGGAVG